MKRVKKNKRIKHDALLPLRESSAISETICRLVVTSYAAERRSVHIKHDELNSRPGSQTRAAARVNFNRNFGMEIRLSREIINNRWTRSRTNALQSEILRFGTFSRFYFRPRLHNMRIFFRARECRLIKLARNESSMLYFVIYAYWAV